MKAIITKNCLYCGVEFSTNDYRKVYCCKRHTSCASAARWRKNNPEKQKESIKKWSVLNRSKLREYKTKWNLKNPEKIAKIRAKRKSIYGEQEKIRLREWAKNNREKSRAIKTKWKKSNPEKVSNDRHKRRARLRNAVNTLTVAEWKEILEKYGRCLKCGKTEDLQMDHIVPLSRGGSHSSDNVQPLCGNCNYRKGTKTEDYRPK